MAGGLEAVALRNSGPMGVTGMPTLSIQSWKSGGTHRWTSRPSAFNCDASATNGWTSPRDPIVDGSTRMRLPLVAGLHKKTLDMFFEGTDRSGIDDHYDTAPAARDALCRAEEEATTIR